MCAIICTYTHRGRGERAVRRSVDSAASSRDLRRQRRRRDGGKRVEEARSAKKQGPCVRHRIGPGGYPDSLRPRRPWKARSRPGRSPRTQTTAPDSPLLCVVSFQPKSMARSSSLLRCGGGVAGSGGRDGGVRWRQQRQGGGGGAAAAGNRSHTQTHLPLATTTSTTQF